MPFCLMISKLCASWLIVLVLSPFTAPFWTCDLARSLQGAGQRSPFAPQMVVAGAIDTNAALVRVALITDWFSSVQGHEPLFTILRL